MINEARQPTERPREKGLTLVELVISVSILAVGAVLGLMLLVQAQKANNFSRAKTRAINAAEEQLEQIFMDSPGNVINFNNVTFAVPGMARPGGAPAGLIAVSNAQPHLVTVSVVWEGQGTLAPGQVTLTAERSEAER